MAETEEGLWMSAKERDRLKVLHEVRKRHITQRQAAAELGISVRWVRTLLNRLRVHGDRGLRHRLRGKGSNHKAPEELKRRAVELIGTIVDQEFLPGDQSPERTSKTANPTARRTVGSWVLRRPRLLEIIALLRSTLLCGLRALRYTTADIPLQNFRGLHSLPSVR